LPDVIKQATDDYFEGEDIFGRWIDEKCQCEPGLKTKASDLYKSWKEFAEANGEHPGSSKSLAEMLKQRGSNPKKAEAPFTSASG
jgi:putative DNA primase/helicase